MHIIQQLDRNNKLGHSNFKAMPNIFVNQGANRISSGPIQHLYKHEPGTWIILYINKASVWLSYHGTNFV